MLYLYVDDKLRNLNHDDFFSAKFESQVINLKVTY